MDRISLRRMRPNKNQILFFAILTVFCAGMSVFYSKRMSKNQVLESHKAVKTAPTYQVKVAHKKAVQHHKHPKTTVIMDALYETELSQMWLSDVQKIIRSASDQKRLAEDLVDRLRANDIGMSLSTHQSVYSNTIAMQSKDSPHQMVVPGLNSVVYRWGNVVQIINFIAQSSNTLNIHSAANVLKILPINSEMFAISMDNKQMLLWSVPQDTLIKRYGTGAQILEMLTATHDNRLIGVYRNGQLAIWDLNEDSRKIIKSGFKLNNYICSSLYHMKNNALIAGVLDEDDSEAFLTWGLGAPLSYVQQFAAAGCIDTLIILSENLFANRIGKNGINIWHASNNITRKMRVEYQGTISQVVAIDEHTIGIFDQHRNILSFLDARSGDITQEVSYNSGKSTVQSIVQVPNSNGLMVASVNEATSQLSINEITYLPMKLLDKLSIEQLSFLSVLAQYKERGRKLTPAQLRATSQLVNTLFGTIDETSSYMHNVLEAYIHTLAQ